MVRNAVGALLICGLGLLARDASAGGWQEAHETSDDVTVSVGPDGLADITHHLRYRIVAGRFKSFEIVGLAPRAEIVPTTALTPEKGGTDIPARIEPSAKTPGTVRIV